MYFKRGNQYWKEKSSGQILLINTELNCHLFLKKGQFNNRTGASQIQKSDFDLIKKQHVRRLKETKGKIQQSTLYFTRENQYWNCKANGEILVLNTKTTGHHYNGDGHILSNIHGFDLTTRTIKISKEEFNLASKKHFKQLSSF